MKIKTSELIGAQLGVALIEAMQWQIAARVAEANAMLAARETF